MKWIFSVFKIYFARIKKRATRFILSVRRIRRKRIVLKKTVPTLVKVHQPNLANKKNYKTVNKLDKPKRQALKRNCPNRLSESQWLEKKWPARIKIHSENLNDFNKSIPCRSSPTYIPSQKKSHFEKNRLQPAMIKLMQNSWTAKISILFTSRLPMNKPKVLFNPQPKKIIISPSKLHFLPGALTMPNDSSSDRINKAKPDNVIPKHDPVLERLDDKVKMWSRKQQECDAALEYDRVKAKKLEDESIQIGENIYDILEEMHDVDQRDHKGRTALHIATEHNCFRLVKTLIELGANRKIKNSENKTPLEISFSKNNEGNHLNAFRIKVKLIKLAIEDKDWITINKLVPSLQEALASFNPQDLQEEQIAIIKKSIVTDEEYKCIKDYVSKYRTL